VGGKQGRFEPGFSRAKMYNRNAPASLPELPTENECHPESPYKLLHIRDYDIITHQGFLSQERRSLIHSLDICLLNRYLLGEWIRDDRLFWFIPHTKNGVILNSSFLIISQYPTIRKG